MDKICQHCGMVFTTEHESQLYCTPRCKNAARRIRQGLQPPVRRSWKSGDRFGRLVLVEYQGGKKGRQLWFCVCDCGTEKFLARADKLKDGRQQSCGCLARELREQNAKLRQQRKAEQDVIKETLRSERELKKKDEVPLDVARKHRALKLYLSTFYIPNTDPLWSPRYYEALIADGCHYCHGPLESVGASVDFKDAEQNPVACNTVAACVPCIDHRSLFHSPLSFEEMEVLGQTLELIRLQREAKGTPSSLKGSWALSNFRGEINAA